jgi:FimV-like protein
LLFGCASDPGRDAPDVALSSGVFAQSEFRTLRSRFFDGDATGRIALARSLESFLGGHNSGARAPQVRVFLAWAYMERGDRDKARKILDRVVAGPDGPTRDFARVAVATLAAREGKTKQALDAFEKLEGRLVDLDERFVYGEERTRAAFVAGDRKIAMGALLAWLAQAPPDRLERARTVAKTLLGLAPVGELALALRDLGVKDPMTSPELGAARVWVTNTIIERLTRVAIDRADQDLARRVLDVAPAALRGTPDGQKLVKLSTSGTKAPAIAGRAVGLLLDLGDATRRRRAAAASAGMTRALGSADGATGGKSVELIVRTASARVEDELAELASEGAALFVAGIDDESARSASAFAESHGIPVLLLRKPPVAVSGAGYTFVLGLGDAEIERALDEALSAKGFRRTERVGPGGVPCEPDTPVFGGPRFPLGEFRKNAVSGLVVTGDALCARDLAGEVKSTKSSFLLALGLEASEAYATLGVPTLVVSTGGYPDNAPHGGWYEALGHDAALLAARALEALPREGLVRGGSVEVLHEKARDALARAEAALWTSEARGFGNARVLPRKLGVVEGGTSSR